MTQLEVCQRVIERLARIHPELPMRVILHQAERAMEVVHEIQELPSYSQVINMTHLELNLALQQCPESPLFARDDYETTEAAARKLVLRFVERARYGS